MRDQLVGRNQDFFFTRFWIVPNDLLCVSFTFLQRGKPWPPRKPLKRSEFITLKTGGENALNCELIGIYILLTLLWLFCCSVIGSQD